MKSFFSRSTVWLLVLLFAGYFGVYNVLRYQTLHSAYFDLGIMHQTVYNTYRALITGEYGRILELTDPHGSANFMRAAVHVDLIMALFAGLYFINPTPATLVVAQAVIVALGGWAVYKIALHLFERYRMKYWLGVTFVFLYLMHPALQMMTMYDFHAVSIGTTTMLFFILYLFKKRYLMAGVYFILTILSKEQVALTCMMWALYMGYEIIAQSSKRPFALLSQPKKFIKALMQPALRYPLFFAVTSIIWFILAVFVITPYYRGEGHFALERYESFGSSPGGILVGILLRPVAIIELLLNFDTLKYLTYLFGPYSFLPLFSPLALLVLVPELAINMLSNNSAMRGIQHHYTAILHPTLIVAAMLGGRRLLGYLSDATIPYHLAHTKHHHNQFTPLRHVHHARAHTIFSNRLIRAMGVLVVTIVSLFFSAWIGPLPYSMNAKTEAFEAPSGPQQKVYEWQYKLKDENVRVSTTTSIAPFFSGRRYYYYFSTRYVDADYIVIMPSTITKHEYDPSDLVTPYNALKKDRQYELIDQGEDFEVYKKITAAPLEYLPQAP